MTGLLSLLLLGSLVVAWYFRRRALKAEALRDANLAKAQHWFDRYYALRATWAEEFHPDPRIANASPEKIRAIYRDIFAPVRPSPLDSSLHCDAENEAEAAALLIEKVAASSGGREP